MHIINFIICLLLPYLAEYGLFGPTQSLVPNYFAHSELVWIAAEFGAVIGFWLGFIRNYVGYNSIIGELGYQRLLWLIIVFMIVSKIIFAIPHMILASMFSFLLGWLAISRGQVVGKFAISCMALISIVIISYFGFILIMVAWFKKSATIYYYYMILLSDLFTSLINHLKAMAL